jgi:tetratricopeptide (TPR) repeat protein
MKILFFIIAGLILFQNCESGAGKKIRLASMSSKNSGSTSSASSVIRILPQEQSSVAIINFINETGDPALQWLERGLADMFVTELSQSPYLNIINSKNLLELARQTGLTDQDLFKPANALSMARRAETDLLLSGKFYQHNDSMYIEVDLRDTHSQKFIRKEVVNGPGMEQLFAMVDNLSEKVRSNIRGDLEEVQTDPINLVEMTTSVEAFRYYSKALENREKFFFTEAEKLSEKAVKADSNFAAGYLLLAQLKLTLGKVADAKNAINQAKTRLDKLSGVDKYQLELLELRFDRNADKIISKLHEAIEKYPSNVEFHLELGRLYREKNDYDNALYHFEIVKELRPNKKTIYNDLGYVHALRQDFKTSLECINTYKEMAPDEPNPYDSAGEILMWAGRLDEAIIQLKKALAIDPTFYHSAEKLGRIYIELGKYPEAFKYIDMAQQYADMEKMSEVIQWRRIMAYWRSGRIDGAVKAIKNFEAGSEKKSGIPDISLAHLEAHIYRSIGAIDKADSTYKEYFHLFEMKIDSIQTYYQIDQLVGLMLMSDIDPEQCIGLLEKIRKNVKDDKSNALINLAGWTLAVRDGNKNLANKYFNDNNREQLKLLTSDPNERWSQVWKYIFKTISSDKCPTDAGKLSEDIMKIAKNGKRDDLILISMMMKAIYYHKESDDNRALEIFARAGLAPEDKWQISGPYQGKNDFVYNHAYSPEILKKNPEFIKIKKPAWQKISGDGLFDGYIDLNTLLGDKCWATAYAMTYIYSPEDQPVEIRIGSDESFKLWLNDNIVLSRYLERDTPFDDSTVKVLLHSGYNKLMIKVVNRTFDWGFLCRITDDNGNGIDNITFYHPGEIDRNYAVKE